MPVRIHDAFCPAPGAERKGFAEVNPDLMEAAWQALFYPGAVVVVGASPDLTKLTAGAESGMDVAFYVSSGNEAATDFADYLPSFAATGNPVDFTGLDLLRPGLLRDAATVVASDPGVDALVLSHWLSETVDSPGQLKALEQATDKPVLLVGTIPGRSPGSAVPELLRHGVVFVADAGTAARALVAVAQHRGKRRRAGAVRVAPPESATAVPPGLRSLPPGTLLGEREAKELLGSYGIPVVPERAAATPEEAVRAAAELGYPVAVKVDAPGIGHKTDSLSVGARLRRQPLSSSGPVSPPAPFCAPCARPDPVVRVRRGGAPQARRPRATAPVAG